MKSVTLEQMLDAIQGSQGLVTKIQKNLEKITGEHWGWETVRNYLDKWPECAVAIKAEKEAMLDLAENNIFKELSRGDSKTSKWYLRMKGKERGYVETHEIVNNGDPLNIKLDGSTETADAMRESPMVEIVNEETDKE